MQEQGKPGTGSLRDQFAHIRRRWEGNTPPVIPSQAQEYGFARGERELSDYPNVDAMADRDISLARIRHMRTTMSPSIWMTVSIVVCALMLSCAVTAFSFFFVVDGIRSFLGAVVCSAFKQGSLGVVMELISPYTNISVNISLSLCGVGVGG